jgi:hypothetical protein
MAAVSLNPLRVFGLFGSAAIVFSTLFTFSLLPALLALLKPRVRAKGEALGGRPATSVLRVLTGQASPRRVAVCALLVAACAVVATIMRLRVDDSWIRNLPPKSDIVQGDRFFNEKLAGTTALELMVDATHGGWFNSSEGMAALGSGRVQSSRLPGTCHSSSRRQATSCWNGFSRGCLMSALCRQAKRCEARLSSQGRRSASVLLRSRRYFLCCCSQRLHPTCSSHGQHTGFVLLNTPAEVQRFSEGLRPLLMNSVEPHDWGVTLMIQARTSGAEADQLGVEAGRKFEAAAKNQTGKHEALYNWGFALNAQAKTKSGKEADHLWTLAREKYEASLKIKPDKHQSYYGLSLTFRSQAMTKIGTEAEQLNK